MPCASRAEHEQDHPTRPSRVYNSTSNSNVVLRTVPLGLPDLTKSRTFVLRFTLAV